MRDAGSSIPEWLQGLVDKGPSRGGYGKWGGKDFRAWGEEADKDKDSSNTGWDNWNKHEEPQASW